MFDVLELESPEERPNYYLAANYRYKSQAVKAFQTAKAFLKDDRGLRAYFLHDGIHGIFYSGNWFVVILGAVPLPDQEQDLTGVLLAAKGKLIQLQAAQLSQMLQEWSASQANKGN